MNFKLTNKHIISEQIEEKQIDLYRRESIEEFNPQVLGLGNIESDSKMISAICAIFDLEGFTNFSKQADPHLSLPVYFNTYLNWIFKQIRNETIEKNYKRGSTLYHDFPFLSKFMGDGLLFLWDTIDMSKIAQSNLIISLHNICTSYIEDFLPIIMKKVVDPPSALRCGIAKGNVFSVGNGGDFVGPCINLASRLQKLPGLHFACSAKGFNELEEVMNPELYSNYVLKKTSIKGMSSSELIIIDKSEFDLLAKKDRKNYLNA